MSRALTASSLLDATARLARSGDSRLPFPDYPCNARSFVNLDARLLPYWHALFDVCPGLLKLDPPEGLELFRRFMTWAYRHHPALDWTYYISVCRWLLVSPYKARVTVDHIEAFMGAAAALWVATDVSQARGLLLAWQPAASIVVEWKSGMPVATFTREEEEGLPIPPWEFSWSPLSGKVQNTFRRWLPVPG
ncbi:putative natural product biosynthesis protein [Pseudomonas cichorii]|uniref:putative natural product biosynthesis protein n=1 Tax=Pseudomonas cichorii TaxID=36746 RepID=UPI001C868D3D|nr:putative natural product biosynthesis protein [Pseudomonas cichorii]MBX8486846.1 putative natural product biosynthesis protein [Pseudomonas cichorii]MBX8490888.1 putative natural product biosynthesis protein [Pseudomonas cichorii]MBX8509030.1 putative natural product biosynthesis protein [Pseudomonas cichorii]MBX8515614.1 putative natural product biosynthesis protein [Pseudomonas cichorii]MBX8518336.1 putative natural product biosynthesis protein [Pseudomonas cichorii]